MGIRSHAEKRRSTHQAELLIAYFYILHFSNNESEFLLQPDESPMLWTTKCIKVTNMNFDHNRSHHHPPRDFPEIDCSRPTIRIPPEL